eukprot:TRINITY_DN8057_c0_g1_i1.p1 TRINITY_DN8057_c0_g1~~TRINITY_DN8057_c0_g1_i1.p1  ORF type:complete len:1206 (-),score=371.97 TRINITY_DN8057_c0_g1_i1:59-3559(-)
MNGSGKSNILDAIVFVLGVTNWQQLRAQTLNSLVYKDGQAGVRKASVTLVFNNEDKTSSPLGYEKFDKITVTRQVTIGGTSKYLINGHNAQMERVYNLFRSVQLNVKNPHFLIMQGHISKVLNMKPKEILGLIEEAAGTKLYEDKRAHAQKILDKKDKKCEEIKQIIAEQIMPQLEKFKAQGEQYASFQANQRQLAKLEKFRVAYEYMENKKLMSGSDDQLNEYQEKIDALEEEIKENQVILKETKEEIMQLTEKKEKEMSTEVHELEEKVDTSSKHLVKHETVFSNLTESRAQEVAKAAELERVLEKMRNTIDKKQKQLDEQTKLLEEKENSKQACKEQLENLKRQYQAVSVGVAAGGGTAKTLADQLMDAKREASHCDTEGRSCAARLKHMKKELEQSKKQEKQSDTEYKQMKAEEQKLQKELQNQQKELTRADFDEGRFQELSDRRRNLAGTIRGMEQQISSKKMSLQFSEFHYDAPPSFDRSRVHGRVMHLVDLKNSQYSSALGAAAGGKLYNVVVDDESTGRELLKTKLRNRETMIPLRQIQCRTLQRKQVETAYDLVGKDNVAPALSLLQYSPDNEPAINFVFGTTFVSHSSDAAQKVTFHKDILARTVTMDGDIFEPAGTLTGGSKPQSADVLGALSELRKLQQQCADCKEELAQVDRELNSMTINKDKYQELKHKADLKEQEISLLTQRIQRTSYFQLQERVTTLTAQIEENERLVTDYEEKHRAALEKAEELQEQMRNFNKEDQLEKTKKNIKLVKKQLEDLNEELKSVQQLQVRYASEVEQLKEEYVELEAEKNQIANSIVSMDKDVEAAQKQRDSSKAKYEKLKALLDAKKDDCLATDSSIAELIAKRDALNKAYADAQISIKKIVHKITSFNAQKEKATRTVEAHLKNYPWIHKEEQYFGKENTEYDFVKKSISSVLAELKKVEEKLAFLSQRVNEKAANMHQETEQDFHNLVAKQTQLATDKAQIEKFIAGLDEKKNKTLKETYKMVDKHFGNIFTLLLPGTKAKLEPEEGKSVLEGLRIRVALGSVWKENLSELSGGQRSLLALSLVLSLLLAKPAPVYILDEIDSALDLSHTQNIGEMLKTYFTQSQFIIISLKEGMFNNANVLFKVKNVNGSSQVTRIDTHTAKKTKSGGRALPFNEADDQAKGQKRKRQ